MLQNQVIRAACGSNGKAYRKTHEEDKMLDFLLSHWLVVSPTALAGLYLLGILKRQRDAQAARRAPAPIDIER